MESILSVKLDYLFKQVFGNEHNIDILANFLSAVLSMPVERFAEVQLLDTHQKKTYPDDKLSILDINLRTKDGLEVLIEIQIHSMSGYEKRSVYYISKRIEEQLSEGDAYARIRQTISIHIVDFTLFPYEKYHSTFWLAEETEGYRLTDVFRIDYLELPKAKKHTENGLKQQWMDFINAESKEDLQMLTDTNDIFKRPVAEVIRLSGDAAVRAEYEARQKAIRDEIARRDYAVREAEIRVARESKVESARNLLGLLSPEVIAERIGLPLETVLQIAKEKV